MGSSAPWAALPADRRRQISLDRVRDALAGIHGAATPEEHRVPPGDRADDRRAAVLVPLFEEDGEVRVILTVRSDQLRSHQGEVAFPGGRLEAGEGVIDAALREASEEVGLDLGLVVVIGSLTTTATVSSGTEMTPVVGILEARPTLVANPEEVASIFDVALADLVADGVFHEERWTVPGRAAADGFPDGEFPVWFFDVAEETVWGATARTLVELVSLVLGVPVPPSLVQP